jgi:hypothetical protein
MAPVRSLLQQHLAAAEAAPPGSPDEAAFRQQVLPQLHSLLASLQQPLPELLQAVEEGQQRQERPGIGDAAAGGKVNASRSCDMCQWLSVVMCSTPD